MDGNIEMEQVNEIKRRKLVEQDLLRINLPRRYWKVNVDGVSDHVDQFEKRSSRDILVNYIKNIDVMFSRGLGLLLWGANGCGKTSMAAIIAKEYRRRYKTVLFIEAAKLKALVSNKTHFDEDQTYWERAHAVDVLVLDDLGKGVKDSKEFGERLIDELIRTRNGNMSVTIVTTNAVLRGEGETLSGILKPSTMHSLKEHVIPVHVRGEDRRNAIADAIKTETQN